jgi:hypothetical protein
MLGVEGQRMAKIFNFIIELVSEPGLATQRDSPMEILELSLSVLSKIIDCNTRNIANSECDRLVSVFAQIVKSRPGEKDHFFSITGFQVYRIHATTNGYRQRHCRMAP